MSTENEMPFHYDPAAPRRERYVAADLPTMGWCVVDRWRCSPFVYCGSDSDAAVRLATSENEGTDDPRTPRDPATTSTASPNPTKD